MADESIGVSFGLADVGEMAGFDSLGGRVVLPYSSFFAGIFNLPPGMTCDGHCRLKTDNLFSADAADAIRSGRDFQINLEVAQFRRMKMQVTRDKLVKMHNMVPLDTDLFRNVVLEDVGGGIPRRVREFYDGLFARSGVGKMNRELRMQLFNMLRGMPGCCVPAAILGSQLLRQKIILCRLGFRDPHRKTIYDWEYGEHGVAWV